MPQSKYRISRWLAPGLLVCCTLLPSLAAADVRTAKIGFASRMTDVLAQSAWQGAGIAVDDANQQRPKGAEAIRFELLMQDDHGNPNLGPHVAAYFVKSRVSGVVGHWSSDVALAVADIYEQAGIAQVNFTSSTSALTSRGYKTAFRVVGSTTDGAMSLADAAVDVLQGQRIMVIGNDSMSSKAVTNAFVERLAARSKKALPIALVGMTTSDFNAVLKSAIDEQADVIFFSAYVAQAPAFLAAVKRLNIKARILLSPGATNQNIAAQDNGAFYALEAEVPQEQCPAWKSFTQKFQAKYGRAPTTYSRYAYNATGALILAIREANSVDPAQVALSLHNIRYAGLGGDIVFDKAGNRVNPPYTLYHLEGGSWKPVRIFSSDKSATARCARS